MNWSEINALSEIHGDSFFVFDKDQFIDNFHRLNDAFNAKYSNTTIGYSYKTNYTPTICKLVNELGGFAEIVSEMEFDLAEMLGIAYEKIIYNGPYKSDKSLRKALLKGCIVNLDSQRDLNILLDLADTHSTTKFEVSIRCNFALDDELVSRFGMDINEDFFGSSIKMISDTPNVELTGLHCHFPNRAVATYRTRINQMLDLIDEHFTVPPKFINIGGGFFGDVPEELWDFFGGSPPPSFDDYAEVIGCALSNAFPNEEQRPVLFIEPGTALVANTFRFYTKIINTKTIRERNIATASGSIFNISPSARNINLPLTLISNSVEKRSTDKIFDIGGFTCIEGDYLSKNVRADIRVGDFAEYQNVGSYSIVMKPPFILPSVPILMTEKNKDQFRVIKKKETTEYIFENFVDI
mgnify:CR=1 FL=1